MTQIAISDDVAHTLAEAAALRGCGQEELASAAIDAWLREQDVILSPEEDSIVRRRLSETISGADLGSEAADQKFDAFFDKLRSR